MLLQAVSPPAAAIESSFDEPAPAHAATSSLHQDTDSSPVRSSPGLGGNTGGSFRYYVDEGTVGFKHAIACGAVNGMVAFGTALCDDVTISKSCYHAHIQCQLQKLCILVISPSGACGLQETLVANRQHHAATQQQRACGQEHGEEESPTSAVCQSLCTKQDSQVLSILKRIRSDHVYIILDQLAW